MVWSTGTPHSGSTQVAFGDTRHPSDPDLRGYSSRAGPADARGSGSTTAAPGAPPPPQQMAAHRDSQFFLGPIGGLVDGDHTSWNALNKFLSTLQGGRAYRSTSAQAAAEQSLVDLAPGGGFPVGYGPQGASGSTTGGSRAQLGPQQQSIKESSGLYVYYKVRVCMRTEGYTPPVCVHATMPESRPKKDVLQAAVVFLNHMPLVALAVRSMMPVVIDRHGDDTHTGGGPGRGCWTARVECAPDW
jgi:hypothetical protein